MSRVILGTLLALSIVGAFIYMRYGDIKPVDDVSGCYVAPLGEHSQDRVCLFPPGEYVQEFIEQSHKVVRYNEGKMRIFKHRNDQGEFQAITLEGFVVIDIHGNKMSTKTFEIVPSTDLFGTVSFDVGKDIAGEVRMYVRSPAVQSE